MKRIFLCCILFLLILVSGGCNKEPPPTAMEQIQEKLLQMEGYSCLATLTRTSNKSENVYETKQDFKNTGEYRLELLAPDTVKGNLTICDGKAICQYNPHLKEQFHYNIPPSPGRNQLFLGQFIKNYMQSEDVSVETAALEESHCTVLEAVIPQNSDALASEKLWVDTKTLLPVRFILYDKDGIERYRLDYHEFTYNPTFAENLFVLPE